MADIAPVVPAAGRLILDTGGVLALAARSRRARSVLDYAASRRMRVLVPAVVVAQCIRGGPRDAPVNRVLRAVGDSLIVTELLARQAGVLLGAAADQQPADRQSWSDAVEAIVVAAALQDLPAAILTSDPGDIGRLVQASQGHGQVQVIAV
ncbi:MAG TPA: hypothetical protein VFW96_18930 [Thermomicrobiales bacterium]|nr:hypothetical protein [Thermomicrobiales bacterium]